MDEYDKKRHFLHENEFVGTLKAVKQARKGDHNREPKPEEVFDMNFKEGGEVKYSKKVKNEIVMPYQKKNWGTGKMEAPKNNATYRKTNLKLKKKPYKK